MLIIGFGNKARAGKDSAAEAIYEFYQSKNHLFQKHGQTKAIVNVGLFKFATALYHEVNEFLAIEKSFDYSTAELFKMGIREVRGGKICVDKIPEWVTPDPHPEVSGLSPYGKHPKLLQWWGTEFRRAQDPNYWVKKMYDSIPSSTDIALVSDVRFPNEADSITRHGGYNVNVTRLNQDGTQYYATDRPSDHPSEVALDSYNWQFRLTNHDGHQALLEEQAITICEYLKGLNK